MLLVFLLMALWGEIAFAEGVTDEQKRLAAELDSEIGGLPAIFRTPETGFAFGAVLVYVPKSLQKKPDPLITGAMYTEKKQFLWALGTKRKIGTSDISAKVFLELLNFPQKYFGSGSSTQDRDEQLIGEKRALLDLGLEIPIWDHLSLGLSIVARRDEFSSLDIKNSSIDYDSIYGIEGGNQRGTDISLNWDDVDDVFFPSKGMKLSIGRLDYHEFLGSEYPHHSWYIDARRYKRLSTDLIWARRLYGRFQSGGVPYYQLEKLGGHSLLRGYFSGRYRDRNIFVIESELRYQLYHQITAVGFIGFGDVAHKYSYFKSSELKPSYGGGLRYQLTNTQKINLRADIGIGNEGPQLYLYVLEAF